MKNNQKKAILDLLENAYAGAEAMHDTEMVCRLTRAIIAFNYDDLESLPSWEEMFEAYAKMNKVELKEEKKSNPEDGNDWFSSF